MIVSFVSLVGSEKDTQHDLHYGNKSVTKKGYE